MYLIYNREYELVGEADTFSQVKDVIGEDITEQDVNSLKFTRGKTVFTEDNLKRVIHNIVTTEKNSVVEYITSEIEVQEDETVELKTSNRHLQNKVHETKGYLAEVSSKIGRVLEGANEATPFTVNGTPEEVYGEEPDLEEEYEKSTQESPQEEYLDSETRTILQHIERSNKSESIDKPAPKKKSASRVIPNRKKKGNTDINFISIIEGGKVTQIKDLKGKTLIKTTKLAEDVGLDREHVEYLIQVTLKECGGTPKYQNKSVVSQAEAVWVIVSALTKREGFGNAQRFQKTKENSEDFYQSWEQQREDITDLLN